MTSKDSQTEEQSSEPPAFGDDELATFKQQQWIRFLQISAFVKTHRQVFICALLGMLLACFVCCNEPVEIMESPGLPGIAKEAHNVVHSVERLIRVMVLYVVHWVI